MTKELKALLPILGFMLVVGGAMILGRWR